MNDLLGVLIRFRQRKVAIVADIEAMFHQVRMIDSDRDVLRFLWWENGNLDAQPKEYRMCVHLFGATSSPCCSSKALKQTADDNEKQNEVGKMAIETIRTGFYVDDCLSSVESIDVAKHLVQRLSGILSEGGFRLTKWLSNNRDVLDSIDESERAPSVSLFLDELPTERTLGVCWDAGSDSFTFQLTPKDKPMTRRGLLSVTSSVFDPLGIAAPFVLLARSLLQEVCRRGADWDQPLTEDEKKTWTQWLDRTSILSQVSVPRWVKLDITTAVQMHIFCDASEKGYAAVAYFRIEPDGKKPTVEFIIGRARVTPLKLVTIPRLELMAAVLAATLDSTIRRELSYSINETVYWSDSMIVLSYIRNENRRYKTFVANRVSKILSESSKHQWRHVPTKENPADEGSRGTYELGKWLTGPDFLYKDEAYGKRRWRQVQYLANIFWTRWKKEYLPLLQKRHKWTTPRQNVEVCDIVLLVDETMPRGRWPMGKVISVYKGKDGKVRSVDVKIAGGVLKRPIAKLCIIYRGSIAKDVNHC
ncbi:uncharacterized protein [Antedon mediterranea]|uniref:uncharacterized protein n=1 Tax=Antedon mediterranea TaxID=105859 RepID=UPI003AF46582